MLIPYWDRANCKTQKIPYWDLSGQWQNTSHIGIVWVQRLKVHYGSRLKLKSEICHFKFCQNEHFFFFFFVNQMGHNDHSFQGVLFPLPACFNCMSMLISK